MWPRITEIALALWLIVSPALVPGDDGTTVAIVRIGGGIMLALSLVSLVERLRRAYLGTFAVSLILVAYVLFQPSPASALLQNLMVTALLIAMFAIIPPEPAKPPREWRELETRRRRS